LQAQEQAVPPACIGQLFFHQATFYRRVTMTGRWEWESKEKYFSLATTAKEENVAFLPAKTTFGWSVVSLH